MRAQGIPKRRVTRTNVKGLCWTIAQMVAHHASNGCDLSVGDLIGSGTVSGPTDDSRACLEEITAGRHPVQWPDAETRIWPMMGTR